MFVGTARFVIHIPAAQSLKDRRRVVNQLKDRIRARLSVSVCEVGRADRRQSATIALVTVARDAESCRKIISAARVMAETLGDAWLTDARAEVVSYGMDGENLRGGLESSDREGIFSETDEPKESKEVPAPRTTRSVKKLRPHRGEKG